MKSINFFESNQILFLAFLWLFLVASIICTLFMIVTLVKKGDERRKYIVKKSSLTALIVGIIFLIINIIWNIFFEQNSRIGFEESPIIYIGIISIAFNISQVINMKKYEWSKVKNHIKEIRTEKGLFQQELADICEVSRQTVNAIENNKYDPTLELAFKLAAALETTVDNLFIYE